MGFITARSPLIAGMHGFRGVRGLGQEAIPFGDMDPNTAAQTMVAQDASQGADSSGLFDLAKQALQSWSQFRSQDQIMTLNVERAKKGLPPIDPSGYAPGVQVGLSAGMQNTVMMIAGAIAVAVLGAALLKRR